MRKRESDRERPENTEKKDVKEKRRITDKKQENRGQMSIDAKDVVKGRQEVEEVGSSRGGRKLPGDEGRAEKQKRRGAESR